ncbi:MAG: hypothetical protein ACP5F3_01805, partial [Candidatus Syntrophosphaera sp.]
MPNSKILISISFFITANFSKFISFIIYARFIPLKEQSLNRIGFQDENEMVKLQNWNEKSPVDLDLSLEFETPTSNRQPAEYSPIRRFLSGLSVSCGRIRDRGDPPIIIATFYLTEITSATSGISSLMILSIPALR